MPPQLVFVLHLVATWYMVGLIWMVQIVHYAMFDRVGPDQFAAYEADHNRLITPIVAVPMLLELVTGCWLCLRPPDGLPRSAAVAGLITIALIWITTAIFSVPYHQQLMNGFDAASHRGLVGTNWIRTLLWTARGIGLAYLTARMLRCE